jgi:hypothetical protein
MSGGRLTQCEAFLLRLGRKPQGIGAPALVNRLRLCENEPIMNDLDY